MNLAKLFEMQRQLDQYIEQKHPRQKGEDRLAKKILALQVEIGELANEWRGFKYWSHDQEPRIVEYCSACGGSGVVEHFNPFDEYGYMQDLCQCCNGSGTTGRMPLLEEYVDALHFVLSIGLEINHDMTQYNYYSWGKYTSITKLISELMKKCYVIGEAFDHDLQTQIQMYIIFLCQFIVLGKMLGFTWDEIETAYMQKYAENIARQERGY